MNALRLGSKGPDVVVWQKLLNADAGLWRKLFVGGLAPDGDFGPKTAAETRAWQKERGLVPDGVVGPETWAKAISPPAAREMTKGLDASSVQGLLPYDRLGDYGFVILKGQQGNDGFDPFFERNYKGALDHGIEPFVYCFAYPLPKLDPKLQAGLFVDRAYAACPEMRGRPFFIDEEWPEVVPLKPGGKGWKEWGCSPPQVAGWMRDNAAEVRRLTGRKPVLYTYDWWWSAVRDGSPACGFPEKGDVSWASDCDLWMAWYRQGWPVPGMSPKVPAPFSDWLFWQFDGNGGLVLPNGRDADFCVFNGSREELRAWATVARTNQP
jgi:lysozyme